MDITGLLQGNRIYANKVDRKLLRDLSEEGQKPIATVISCSDSRVPVEAIFNQLEPGKLFVIRVAGNVVADSSVLGSIEYAVEHLKTPYLVVLGHTECGAMKACLEGVREGEIGKLVNYIKVESKELNKAIIENVELQVKTILEMDCIKKALDKDEIEVYGMLYDLRTGKVNTLSKNGVNVS